MGQPTQAGDPRFPAIPPVFALASTTRAWGIYILLAGVLAWFSFGDLRFHLLEMHDAETFLDNKRISADFSYFFSTNKTLASGRLLHEFCMWLALMVWGPDPAAFHLLNVTFHFATSLLLSLAVARAGASVELGMLAGLFFLLHVGHFHAVHWISGFNYVLALLLSLCALLACLRYMEEDRPSWLVACYGSLILGSFSHLSSLMAWPCLLYLTWSRGRHRALSQLAPFALLLAPILVLTLRYTTKQASTWEALDSYAIGELWHIAVGVIRSLLWFACRLLTTAFRLPEPPMNDRQPWELAVGTLVVAALALLVWRRGPVAPWAAWTLLMLLPFILLTEKLTLVQPMEPSRYLYMASAGSSALLAWLVLTACRCCGRWRHPVCALTVVIWTAYSATQLKDAEALSYYSSERYYVSTGDIETGIALYRRALAQSPEALPLDYVYYRLCNLLLATGGDFGPVLAEAREALPTDDKILALYYALESLSLDPRGRDIGLQKMGAILDSSAELESGKSENLRSMIATIYHHAAQGLALHGMVDRAANALEIALIWDAERELSRQFLENIERAREDDRREPVNHGD